DEVPGRLGDLQQRLHVLTGSAERLTGRNTLQGVPAGVEDDRVPRGGGDRLGVSRDAPAAEIGAGVVGRLGDRLGDLLVGGQAVHLPGVHQPVVQPTGTA